MAQELQPAAAALTNAAVVGEVVDPAGLAVRAAEVAARHRSPETRRTYAAVYRTFTVFLGAHTTAKDLTPEAARAYRGALERAGRSPATGRQAPLRAARPRRRRDEDGALGPRRARRAARPRSRRVGAALRMPDRRTRGM